MNCQVFVRSVGEERVWLTSKESLPLRPLTSPFPNRSNGHIATIVIAQSAIGSLMNAGKGEGHGALKPETSERRY